MRIAERIREEWASMVDTPGRVPARTRAASPRVIRPPPDEGEEPEAQHPEPPPKRKGGLRLKLPGRASGDADGGASPGPADAGAPRMGLFALARARLGAESEDAARRRVNAARDALYDHALPLALGPSAPPVQWQRANDARHLAGTTETNGLAVKTWIELVGERVRFTATVRTDAARVEALTRVLAVDAAHARLDGWADDGPRLVGERADPATMLIERTAVLGPAWTFAAGARALAAERIGARVVFLLRAIGGLPPAPAELPGPTPQEGMPEAPDA